MLDEQTMKYRFSRFDQAKPSIMSPLGLVEGDVLSYVEENGSITLRKLCRVLGWSSQFISMAVGSLIRRGLLLGIQHEMDLLISPVA